MPRPLKHGDKPAPAAERLRASREALRARGGRMVTILMEPEELAMLARLREARGFATDREAITHALATALRRR